MKTFDPRFVKEVIPAALLMMFLAGAVPAQEEAQEKLYKWEDENGHVTFSSSPPPEGVEATIIKLPPSLDEDAAEQQLDGRVETLDELTEQREREDEGPRQQD